MVRKIAVEQHVLCPGFEDYRTSTMVDLAPKKRQEFFARLTDFGDMRLQTMDRAGIEHGVLSLSCERRSR